MNIPLQSYLLIGICVISLVAGQLLFKGVSSHITNLGDIFRHGRIFAMFAGALALYFTSTFLWLLALRHVPLSQAYMFTALGFILVPLGAAVFFGEVLTWKIFLGGCFIIIGLLITNF